MTDRRRITGDAPSMAGSDAVEAPSDWVVGWTSVSAILMVVTGAWWFLVGLGLLEVGSSTLAGWVQVLVGLIVVAASYALFLGAGWARLVGVLIVIWTGFVMVGVLGQSPTSCHHPGSRCFEDRPPSPGCGQSTDP